MVIRTTHVTTIHIIWIQKIENIARVSIDLREKWIRVNLLESNLITHISKQLILLNLKLRFTCEETNSVCFLNNAMQRRGWAASCQYLRNLHINGLVEFDELVVLFCNTFAATLHLSNSIRQICYYVAFDEEEASE
jgi:hypothetical protein